MNNISLYRTAGRVSSGISYPILHQILHAYRGVKHIELNIDGIDNVPKEGPCMVVPKHQSWLDIPLVGECFYHEGIRPLFFFRDFGILVNPLLKAFNGVRVARMEDIRKLKNREERNGAHCLTEYAYKRFSYELDCNGFNVIFAEGTRKPGIMGRLKPGFFEKLFEYEDYYGYDVPILPVGIEYNGSNNSHTKAIFRFGELIYRREKTDENVIEETHRAIQRLSNL